jgi:hypothetical protein
MTELKHITPENKERLVKLINKTASFVNNGMHPTDALVKAASDEEYPPEFIMRAAEAYNGAAHLAYFKSASIEDRGNSFYLADGEKALNKILNSADIKNKIAEKTSFAYVSESQSFFDSQPIDDSFIFSSKAASNTVPCFNELQKNAAALSKREKLSVEIIRNRYNEACESLANSIKYFKEKTAGVSSYRRAHWARETIEKHGKGILDVVSLATGVTGKDCEKLAEDRVGYFSLGIEELNSLDNIVKNYNQTVLLNSKFAQAEHDAYVNGIERSTLLNVAAGVKKSFLNPTEYFSSETVGKLIPGSEATREEIQRGALESLADPEFVDESTRIDNALNIHKLMKTDPIIAGYDPKNLEEALREIYSIAPIASKQLPLLRSMLRRRLEAGDQIDDFSLNQMLTMEEKMRDQRREFSVVPKLTGLYDNKDMLSQKRSGHD